MAMLDILIVIVRGRRGLFSAVSCGVNAIGADNDGIFEIDGDVRYQG